MTQQKQNHFKVIAKCGHVGKMKYVPIAFAVTASSASIASQLVRKFPRVKKQCADAILSCTPISKKEYKELRKANRENPYLSCKCKRDQEQIVGFKDLILECSPRVQKRKSEPALSVKYRKFRYDLGGSRKCTYMCYNED